MWLIGFLVIIWLYIRLVSFLANFTNGKPKIVIHLVSYLVPISVPFWHYLYPDYRQFKALCEKFEISDIKKTVSVDYIYVDSLCKHHVVQYPEIAPYKGYVCAVAPRTNYTLYTKPAKFNKEECMKSCSVDDERHLRQPCMNSCMEEKLLINPDHIWDASIESNWISPRLYVSTLKYFDPQEGELGSSHRAIYYPMGRGWATVLGGASGEAPHQSCESPRLKIYDLYKPK